MMFPANEQAPELPRRLSQAIAPTPPGCLEDAMQWLRKQMHCTSILTCKTRKNNQKLKHLFISFPSVCQQDKKKKHVHIPGAAEMGKAHQNIKSCCFSSELRREAKDALCKCNASKVAKSSAHDFDWIWERPQSIRLQRLKACHNQW